MFFQPQPQPQPQPGSEPAADRAGWPRIDSGILRPDINHHASPVGRPREVVRSVLTK